MTWANLSRQKQREAAARAGLKYFFTGVTCLRGHVANRYVCNGTCVECALSKSKRANPSRLIGPPTRPAGWKAVSVGEVFRRRRHDKRRDDIFSLARLLVSKTCPICDKTFETRLHNQCLCSEDCVIAAKCWRSHMKNQRRPKSPKFGKCKCGNTFRKLGGAQYCSEACSKRAHRKSNCASNERTRAKWRAAYLVLKAEFEAKGEVL
jgi:hypothetical protein